MEALLFVIAGCILLGWGPRVLLACIVIPIVLAVLALLTANQSGQHAASPAEAPSPMARAVLRRPETPRPHIPGAIPVRQLSPGLDYHPAG